MATAQRCEVKFTPSAQKREVKLHRYYTVITLFLLSPPRGGVSARCTKAFHSVHQAHSGHLPATLGPVKKFC